MCQNNFYSIDKLVEFGMGMGIATQMANSMNKILDNTNIPGAGKPSDTNSNEAVYYAIIDGKQAGPFSLTEIARLIGQKKIVKETHLWKLGMSQWGLAENIPEIMRLVALTPPPLPGKNAE